MEKEEQVDKNQAPVSKKPPLRPWLVDVAIGHIR